MFLNNSGAIKWTRPWTLLSFFRRLKHLLYDRVVTQQFRISKRSRISGDIFLRTSNNCWGSSFSISFVILQNILISWLPFGHFLPFNYFLRHICISCINARVLLTQLLKYTFTFVFFMKLLLQYRFSMPIFHHNVYFRFI